MNRLLDFVERHPWWVAAGVVFVFAVVLAERPEVVDIARDVVELFTEAKNAPVE